MKSIVSLSALALLLCAAALLTERTASAQVTVTAPGAPAVAVPAPVPAVPAVPTPGAERRAIRREERRIDRNDPTGTLAPTVNPNGTVTATPNVGANVNVNAGGTVAVENWRYRQQNGTWLYYTPQNTWMMWDGATWNAYTPSPAIAVPVAPVQPAPAVRAYSYPTQTYYYGRPYRRGLFGRRWY